MSSSSPRACSFSTYSLEALFSEAPSSLTVSAVVVRFACVRPAYLASKPEQLCERLITDSQAVEFGKTLANSLDFYKLLLHLPTVFELPKIVVPSKLRKLVVGVPVFSVVSAPTCTIPASAFRPSLSFPGSSFPSRSCCRNCRISSSALQVCLLAAAASGNSLRVSLPAISLSFCFFRSCQDAASGVEMPSDRTAKEAMSKPNRPWSPDQLLSSSSLHVCRATSHYNADFEGLDELRVGDIDSL
jgi:hypothetical protein